MTAPTQALRTDLPSDSESYFICLEPNCNYHNKHVTKDPICPCCYSTGIVIDIDELVTAPDGAVVLEYVYEQMGFK